MIVCPNCSHQNPEGAVQCEACYTPLPSMVTCSNCGASVQSDASFCGQCGANLTLNPSSPPSALDSPDNSSSPSEEVNSIDIPDVTVPDLVEFDPLMEPEPLTADIPNLSPLTATTEETFASEVGTEASTPDTAAKTSAPSPVSPSALESTIERTDPSDLAKQPIIHGYEAVASATTSTKATQIQTQSVQLLHAHSNTIIELPPHLAVIHIGKPNDRVPPDIDVSGFQDSEVVSRVHADIRVEGDSYYIEDVGSSNGTYINNIPLAPGNRHKLRSGDRIALGKGDKVSFIIQIA